GHQQEEEPGGGGPPREIDTRRVKAMPQGTQHRLAEGCLVPGALVATAVDVEGGGNAGAAMQAAASILPDARGGGAAFLWIPLGAGRNAQLVRDRVQLALVEDGALLHQCLVRLPEVRPVRRRILRQLRGLCRLMAIGEGEVAVHVAHPISEAFQEMTDDVMRRMA